MKKIMQSNIIKMTNNNKTLSKQKIKKLTEVRWLKHKLIKIQIEKVH